MEEADLTYDPWREKKERKTFYSIPSLLNSEFCAEICTNAVMWSRWSGRLKIKPPPRLSSWRCAPALRRWCHEGFTSDSSSPPQHNGNWPGRSSPPPSPHSDRSDNSDWWPRPPAQNDSDGKIEEGTEGMTPHAPPGCGCCCKSFVWF